MITVNVDELFTSWLSAQLLGVGVSSERPAKLEDRLPFIVIRRGGGGGDIAVDRPIMDLDFFAASVDAVGDLARQVDRLFWESTPVGWRGAQFTVLQRNDGPRKVGDSNAAVKRQAATYTFSVS